MNFIALESKTKLRGGYYTPFNLAFYLSDFIIKNGAKKILEPSCGDGVFFKAIDKISNNLKLSITGFEIDINEYYKAKKSITNKKIKLDIFNTNFLEWTIQNLNSQIKFDAVIGNPPFIRYQYLSKEDQYRAKEIIEYFSLKFTMHTNAWVPFIISSIFFTKPGGYIAFIIPSEILNVIHAQSIRTYLSRVCKRILLIDPEEIWFSGTLQGAVLLIAEKKINEEDKCLGLSIKNVKGFNFLKENLTETFNKSIYINGNTIKGKWTKALLSKDEIELFDNIIKHKNIYKFSDIAKVDVGIVTGANNFFLINRTTMNKYNLKKWVHPMFGRSEHCPGIIYNADQHEHNKKNDIPAYFTYFNVDNFNDLDDNAKEYIILGQTQKLHTRYKCRIRNPWFKVPSIYSTKIGMLKRAHEFHRLIFNEIEALTTDTAYRIKPLNIKENLLVYNFINLITAISCEIEGRNYGGGVLELVPSEIENLYLPIIININSNLSELDKLMRKEKAEDVLYKQSKKLLSKIGIKKNYINILFYAWLKLKNHRIRKS